MTKIFRECKEESRRKYMFSTGNVGGWCQELLPSQAEELAREVVN
jgi:hypothetical protein